MDKGSDPNVISYPAKKTSWDRLNDVGGTAFDLFAQSLRMPYGASNTSRASDSISLTIFERLAGEGSEFSKPFNEVARICSIYQCEYFQQEVEEYKIFEEQSECLRFCDSKALDHTNYD